MLENIIDHLLNDHSLKTLTTVRTAGVSGAGFILKRCVYLAYNEFGGLCLFFFYLCQNQKHKSKSVRT